MSVHADMHEAINRAFNTLEKMKERAANDACTFASREKENLRGVAAAARMVAIACDELAVLVEKDEEE